MSPHLVQPSVFTIDDGTIVLSSPRVPQRLRLSPSMFKILATQPLDVSALNPGQVQDLVRIGFVTDEPVIGTPNPWDSWGVEAWGFHERVRSGTFFEAVELEERQLDVVSDRDAPTSFSARRADTYLLPRLTRPPAVDIFDVLSSRRTVRHFTGESVDRDTLSLFLEQVFSPRRFVHTGGLGSVQLRSYAGGGSRHEIEIYLAVTSVDGIKPGCYRYDPLVHGLEVTGAPSVTNEELTNLAYGQGFFEQASLGVFLVTDWDRLAWKYRAPVAYKIALQNVGHATQVAQMVGHALGLGIALTGAIRFADVDDLFDLDGSRSTQFALACGVPDPSPDAVRLGLGTIPA